MGPTQSLESLKVEILSWRLLQKGFAKEEWCERYKVVALKMEEGGCGLKYVGGL